MRWFKILFFSLLLPAFAHAGEKAFVTGDTRLVYEDFYEVERVIATKPIISTEQKDISLQDAPKGTKVYRYNHVKFVPPLKTNKGLRATGTYNCVLEIIVLPDNRISSISKSGSDCSFFVSDYLR